MDLIKSKQRVADHGEVFTPPWMVDEARQDEEFAQAMLAQLPWCRQLALAARSYS